MSAGNYSTALIVTCRICGAFDCTIIKGLCCKHYLQQHYQEKNAVAIAQRQAIRAATQDPASRKARKAAYYQRNKDRQAVRTRQRIDLINARRRERRKLKSPEVRAAIDRAYYESHKDAFREYGKRYRALKGAELLARRSEIRKGRRDVISAQVAQRRAAGLMVEQDKAHKARRRAQKLTAGGSHTLQDIRTLMKLQRGKCAICVIDIRKKYHVDHINPLAGGGSNDKTNIQLLCPPCNLFKQDKDPIVHMQSLGKLL